MTTTETAPNLSPPTPAVWRPTADPNRVAPEVDVDLARRPAGYPLGVAVGAFGSMLTALGFAFYSLPDDPRGVDLGLAIATLAFLTSLVAAYVHQRRTR